jgi:DNA polymerase-3 subunit delta'
VRLRGVIGQPRALEALERSFASGRFHPSLIFHGPPGVGKLSTALALARGLLCTAPDPPCGGCHACRRIEPASQRHPDLMVVFPEKLEDYRRGETEEGVVGIDLQGRQEAAAGSAAWGLLVDRLRDAIAFVQRRPAEGGRSVLIVDQAQRLSGEGGNALLKTIEEPPPHAVIVLLATSLHALLPTIRSRCQAIPFQTLSPAAVAAWLASERGVPEAEARLRAALSGGRIGAAIGLDLEAFRERRDHLLAALESFLRPPDAGRALARAEEIAKGESPEADLEILTSLVRDRMVVSQGTGQPAGLIHADVAGRLRTLPLEGGPDGTEALVALESALEGLRRRGNRQLLIENAFLGFLPRPAS